MKNLYIIGGPMGVGKTTVCQMLKRQLENAVFLDGDWCWDADPFQVNDETKNMVENNICYLLNNFIHCSSYENVIFCWVMHEQSIINQIIKNLDTEECNIKTVSLLCSEDNLRVRLLSDVKHGIRNADIIERSIARLPLYSRLDTIKIDTTDKPVTETVKEIMNL